MSNEDNGRKSNGPSNNDHNSIFQIMDGIMNELNKTRKIFVFMFFSMMILPVTAIIIFMYTFDEPRVDRDELQANIQEFNTLSQKLKNQMTTFENLQPDRQENELELISNEPKTNLYKKEIRLITFILSIIWIILGIRQYIILSNWGKRYAKFKRQQEEIDKK